jgi:hypothetical protein
LEARKRSSPTLLHLLALSLRSCALLRLRGFFSSPSNTARWRATRPFLVSTPRCGGTLTPCLSPGGWCSAGVEAFPPPPWNISPSRFTILRTSLPSFAVLTCFLALSSNCRAAFLSSCSSRWTAGCWLSMGVAFPADSCMPVTIAAPISLAAHSARANSSISRFQLNFLLRVGRSSLRP